VPEIRNSNSRWPALRFAVYVPFGFRDEVRFIVERRAGRYTNGVDG
jgi:hypothetical protein